MYYKKWIPEISYAALAILIIFFLTTHTPNSIDYDAPSYINFDPIRPPIYPLFIWAFHWAGNYQFELVVWMHAIITFSALMYARYWLTIHLKINEFLIVATCFFVTLTILFHFQIMLIGAEGLTFPFFILSFFLFVECFKAFNLKKIICLALLVSVIILTRLQFYYFYGIYVILVGWYFYKRVPIKSLIVTITILSLSVLLTCAIDRSYHYVKFGSFSSEPATGKLLLVQPLFLTNQNLNINHIKNLKEKKYLKEMVTKMHQKKLNKEAGLLAVTKLSYYEFSYEEYSRNYIKIFSLISTALKNETPNESSIIAHDIAKKLFLNDLQKNIFFISWKFIVFVGGIPLFLFYLIITAALIPKIFENTGREPSYDQLFVSIIILIVFLNAATVALFETYLVGYFCYTQFLFYCLAAFFADRVFFNGTI